MVSINIATGSIQTSLLDTIQSVVVVLDEAAQVLFINLAGCEMLGCQKDAITGKNWVASFIHENSRNYAKQAFDKLGRGELTSINKIELPIAPRHGKPQLFSWNLRALKDEKGNVTGIVASGTCIRNDKALQNQNTKTDEKDGSLLKTGNEGIRTIDEHSLATGASATAAGITGKIPEAPQIERRINREDFLSRITTSLFESPLEQTRQTVQRNLREVNSFMQTDRCYLRIISDDGDKFNCTCTSQSEDAGPDVKWCHELSFGCFNWAGEKLKQGEIIKCKDIDQEIPPEGCNELEQWKAMGYLSILIIPILKEDRLTGWFGFGSGERDKKWDERDIQMLQVIGNYLTLVLDRQATIEKEKELQYILLKSERLAKIGSWEFDLKTNKIIGSPEMFHLFGYTREFPPNLTFDFAMSKIHPEEIPRIELKLKDALTAGILNPFETRLIIDGSVKYIKVDGELIEDNAGQLIKIVGFVQNITELKKSELELKENEARLSMIYNNTSDLMTLCRVNDKNEIIYESFNEPFQRFIRDIKGIEPAESFVGKRVSVITHKYLPVTKTEAQERLSKYYEAIETKKNLVLELVTKLPGIGEVYHETTLAPIVQKGKVTHLLIAVKDISKRKKSEKALRENEERLRLAIRTGKIGVYEWDIAHRKGILNDELKAIFELPEGAEDDLGSHWRSILHPEDKDWVVKGMEEVIKNGKAFKKEYRLQFPDGRVKYVSPTSELMLNEKGEVTRAIGTVVDITERKEAERIFSEQQERLQLVVDATKIGYHDLDMVTGRRYWDENIHKVLKIDPSSDVDRLAWFLSALHPEDKPRVLQRIAVLRSPECKETTFDEDFRLCLDGKIRYFNSKGIIIRDEQGTGLRMLGGALEVTEQKEAELKLKEREERYRTLFENANDAILVLENSKFIECNSLALELYGCEHKAQLLGSTPFHFSPPLQPDGIASEEKGMQYILKALNGQPQRFYWLHCKLNDKSKPIHVEVSLNAFETSDKTFVLAMVRDITERVKMVEALQNSEQQYKTLVETSIQGITIFQHNKIVYINPYAVKMTGYSVEEIYAMTPEDFSNIIHPNDLRRAQKVFDAKREDARKIEYRLKFKSGKYRWFRSLLKHFIYAGHSAMLVTSIDITEQKKARGEIIASAVRAEDQERKRLATELHDGLGQMLTAISLNLGSIKSVEVLDDKSRTNYYAAMKMIRQAMDENRSISHNLMPKAIADYGYLSAVEHLIDNLQDSSSVTLEFFTNMPEERLPEHLERNLYRITQEAVNNIVRHSHAASGVVQLMKYPDLLILTIEDDGQGFDTRTISKTGHLGLQSIKTRSEAIGGILEIDSKPDNGTSITLQISLTDE